MSDATQMVPASEDGSGWLRRFVKESAGVLLRKIRDVVCETVAQIWVNKIKASAVGVFLAGLLGISSEILSPKSPPPVVEGVQTQQRLAVGASHGGLKSPIQEVTDLKESLELNEGLLRLHSVYGSSSTAVAHLTQKGSVWAEGQPLMYRGPIAGVKTLDDLVALRRNPDFDWSKVPARKTLLCTQTVHALLKSSPGPAELCYYCILYEEAVRNRSAFPPPLGSVHWDNTIGQWDFELRLILAFCPEAFTEGTERCPGPRSTKEVREFCAELLASPTLTKARYRIDSEVLRQTVDGTRKKHGYDATFAFRPW